MFLGNWENGAISLGARAIRAWKRRGLRALVKRILWKCGRWLFAPRLGRNPPRRLEAVRSRAQAAALAVWHDLPVESFAPERRLLEIVAAYPGVSEAIVFAPSIGWNTSLFQRPQQLARALARRNCLVFYNELFDPDLETGFRSLGDRLYDCNVPADCFRTPFRIIAEPDCNIARARNLAIAQAQHPVIAVTDFGCRLREFSMTKPSCPGSQPSSAWCALPLGYR